MEGSGDLPDAPAPAVSINPVEAIANPAAPVATEDGTTGMLTHLRAWRLQCVQYDEFHH